MPATESGDGEGRRWPQAVAPWLGIGAAPAALTLGAAMAQRHAGAVPLPALLLGGALMAVLLLGQGRLGLRRPLGDGGTLTEIAPAYLDRRSRLVLGVVLTVAMIGWNGFNVGLGGASLAALTGLPGPLGAIGLEALVFAASFAGPRLGNRIGVVTTLCAIVLIVYCAWQLAPPSAPVSSGLDGLDKAFADMAALGGYIAVFAVRAPDFTTNLQRRRDLWWCVALLVIPAVCACLAGIGIWLRTGEADVVAVLARTQAVGNLFVALAVFTPSLTTTYSGALALRSVLPRVTPAWGMAIVAVPGGILASARFDFYLLPWLAVLAAVLPPMIVPMVTEFWRRRRGLAARTVPTWTWMAPGLVAVALTASGILAAPVVGLLLAGVATAIRHLRSADGVDRVGA